MPDRIETGTYAVAAAVSGGEVVLTGTRGDLLGAVLDALRGAGAEVDDSPSGVRVAASGRRMTGRGVVGLQLKNGLVREATGVLFWSHETSGRSARPRAEASGRANEAREAKMWQTSDRRWVTKLDQIKARMARQQRQPERRASCPGEGEEAAYREVDLD